MEVIIAQTILEASTRQIQRQTREHSRRRVRQKEGASKDTPADGFQEMRTGGD